MEPGQVIGDRFEVRARIGRGGMSAVYRARDRHTGGPAAVKVLGAVDEGLVARFLRESRVLLELEHPGIVRYLAHGRTQGDGYFLAMEWLEGHDLSQWLQRRGALTVGASLELVRAAAAAVAVAHARGVVHRDLKPGNLFLVGDSPGRVKVLDFGIAASLGRPTLELTDPGTALGTPGYMSPEQARGRGGVGPAADVFSLGCVLFACVAGRAPFAADNLMAALVKSMLEPTPRLSDLAPDVPDAVDALALRLMDKDPARRPADARALVEAIDALPALERSSQEIPKIRPRTLTAEEQRLVCAVLVSEASRAPAVKLADAEAETVASAPAPTRPGGAPRPEIADVDARTAAVADQFRGRFAPLVGGAWLVTFEDDAPPTDRAARAAQCALALQAILPESAVVLGSGRGRSGPGGTDGEVVHRTVGLLDVARHHPELDATVLLDETTFGLLEGRFEIFCTPFGYTLIGDKGDGQVQRRVMGRVTPCVGRTRELATLQAIYDECASEPVARAVVLTGPAGVGKSRLCTELLRRLRARGDAPEVWRARGDAIRAGSPFGLVRELVRDAIGIRGVASSEEVQDRLTDFVARRLPASDEVVLQFLGELLDTPFEAPRPEVRAARQDPLHMGDQLRAAFERVTEAAAGPLVLVLEDLHWGDRASLGFVDSLLRNQPERACLVLATTREMDGPPPWESRGVQTVRVGALTKGAARRLVGHVLDDAAEDEVEAVVARGAGHPLLLEELCRAWRDDPRGDLPVSALGLVQARLVGLDPEARRVLRAASVFGRTFWAPGVRALTVGAGLAEAIDERLEGLARQEWIVPHATSRFAGARQYGFPQDLVREALYAMLTDEDRRLGHQLAGAWLAQAGESDHVTLARHFELGDVAERAVRHYRSAAELALDGNDFAATLAHAERARTLSPGRGGGRERLLEAEAHLHLGAFGPAAEAARAAAARLEKGSAAAFRAQSVLAAAASKLGDLDTVRGVARSLRLVEVPDDARVAFASAASVATVQLLIGGDLGLATVMSELLEGFLAQLEDPEPALVGHVTKAIGARWAYGGDPVRALVLLRRAVAAFEAAGDQRNACALEKTRGWYAAESGALEEGAAALRAAVEAAERLHLPNLAAHARYDLGSPLIRLGRLDEARAALEAALPVIVAQQDARLESGALGVLAWLEAEAGRAEAAVALGRRAVARAPSPPTRIAALAFLAQAHWQAGDADAALATADEGLALLETVGGAEEGVARLGLVRAEARRAKGDEAGAEAAIRAAWGWVEARAAELSDEALRASFLSRIAEHRRLGELAGVKPA